MEAVALDADGALEPDLAGPPRWLRQPTDPGDPVPPSRDLPSVRALRDVIASRQVDPGAPFRRRVRSWASQVSGRADRRLLAALAGATDALVTHADSLADRLNAQGATVTDVAETLGSEVTQLRAALLHLQRTLSEGRE